MFTLDFNWHITVMNRQKQPGLLR